MRIDGHVSLDTDSILKTCDKACCIAADIVSVADVNAVANRYSSALRLYKAADKKHKSCLVRFGKDSPMAAITAKALTESCDGLVASCREYIAHADLLWAILVEHRQKDTEEV